MEKINLSKAVAIGFPILILLYFFYLSILGVPQAWTIGNGGNVWEGNSVFNNVYKDVYGQTNNIMIGYLRDSFTDVGTTGWTVNDGNWSIDSGRMKLTGEGTKVNRRYLYSNDSTIPAQNILIYANLTYDNVSGQRRYPSIGWGWANSKNFYYHSYGVSNENVKIGRSVKVLATATTEVFKDDNATYVTPDQYTKAWVNSTGYVSTWFNGSLKGDSSPLGTDLIAGSIFLAGNVQTSSWFDKIIALKADNLGNPIPYGNLTTWYDAGIGYETYQIDVNAITPANTNYTVWSRPNGTRSFTQRGDFYTGNRTIALSPGYRNTDVRIVLNGNQMATPEIISIRFYTKKP